MARNLHYKWTGSYKVRFYSTRALKALYITHVIHAYIHTSTFSVSKSSLSDILINTEWDAGIHIFPEDTLACSLGQQGSNHQPSS